jgi:hypothetical protein
MIGAASCSPTPASSFRAPSAPRAGQDRDPRCPVQDCGAALDLRHVGQARAFEPAARRMRWLIAARAFRSLDRLLLDVVGDRQMRHAALGQRRAAGEADEVLHMRGITDLGIVDGNVREDLGQVHVLLGDGLDHVMELHASDRQHRRAIELGIVEAGQQMGAARP